MLTSIYEHLKSRHLDMNLHRVWIDEEDRCATFPLWNMSGNMTGYVKYSPEGLKNQKNAEYGKYYVFVGEKTLPKNYYSTWMWGLESWRLSNTLFLCEGIFDACRMTEVGMSAVAVLKNNLDKSHKELMVCIRANRPVVVVRDQGDAGKYLGRYGHTVETPPTDDLGDAPQDYIQYLKEKYS